jgi:hypothetical protein
MLVRQDIGVPLETIVSVVRASGSVNFKTKQRSKDRLKEEIRAPRTKWKGFKEYGENGRGLGYGRIIWDVKEVSLNLAAGVG